MKLARNKFFYLSPLIILLAVLSATDYSYGWHDETHLAVAKSAGYHKWYNAVGADMAKLKAGSIESYNHFFDNPGDEDITAYLVLKQAEQYNNPMDRKGHLYGAIIASLRQFSEAKEKKKYAAYHMAFASHYMADLSQPLHNMPYDLFNRTHHTQFDSTVNDEVLDNIDRIKKHMYKIVLRPDRFEEDLAREIARIANTARALGKKLKSEGRVMTKEDAYVELGHSASLLRAVLEHFDNRRR